MKKVSWKRGLAGALAFLMTASAAGCGKGNEGNNEPGQAGKINKDYVYSYEEFSMPMELDNIDETYCRDGKIYVVGTKWEETATPYLCIFNEDGSDARAVGLAVNKEALLTGNIEDARKDADEPSDGSQDADMDDTENADDIENADGSENAGDTQDAGDADGETDLTEEGAADIDDVYVEEPEDSLNIWYANFFMDSNAFLYGTAELYQDHMNEEGEWEADRTYWLICWDKDGEVQWMKDLGEILNSEESYFNTILCDNEDTLWIFSPEAIVSLDTQGDLINRREFEDWMDGYLYEDRNGNLFVLSWNEEYTKQSMSPVDKNTLAFGKEEDAPVVFSKGYNIMEEGNSYDYVLSNSTSLYTYNMEDEEPVKFMDTIDSDLNSSDLQNISMVDDTHFVAVYSDPTDWNRRVAVFTKVPPEEVKDKVPITLAGMYIDSQMKGRIVEFNKTSDTYRIQLKEYHMYWTEEDYMAGYTRLNNDIISGQMPDILLVDSNMPMDSYIAKGLIADLYPLLKADTELSKEDFLENILDAFSQDGKLYELVPEFQVQTLAGKTSLVGDREGWNMEEFQAFVDSLPEGTQTFREVGRNDILSSIVMVTRDEYIDSASGKCSFDSDEFVRVLEFANQFPEEFDYSVFDEEDYWDNRESDYREDRVVLQSTWMSAYGDFNRMEKGDFGEDVTLVGYPSKSRNGSAIRAGMTFALAAKSGSLEGAWDFVRYYLTDDYQEQMNYNFPIKKSALQKKEQEATERPHWENEDGTIEYYDETYYLNGVEITIDPMTAEEAAEFTQFLEGLTLVGEYDQSMTDIIQEEAAAYFEGQKSAKDVASVIQSRMRIYISESR